jgi:hypothetical protein
MGLNLLPCRSDELQSCRVVERGSRSRTYLIVEPDLALPSRATFGVIRIGLQTNGGTTVANGRNANSKRDSGRDPGGFVALPWSVLDCPAYARLSANARALLLEVARQITRDNNGRLLVSRAYMGPRGWKSVDMLTKGKRELLEGGFIFQTVMGYRPNKASWYAVTWRKLDRLSGYDAGAEQGFERGAYNKGRALKNACLKPPHGAEGPGIAPSDGTETAPAVPSHGAVQPTFPVRPIPPHGHHLEKPSASSQTRPKRQNHSESSITQTSNLWAEAVA